MKRFNLPNEVYEFISNKAPHASPSIQFQHNGSAVTCMYDVDFFDHELFIRKVLGYAEVKNTSSSSTAHRYISRHVPDAHPDYNRITDAYGNYLFATKVSRGQGYGVRERVGEGRNMISYNETAEYQKMRFQVDYQTLTYDILTDAQMVQLGYVDENGNPDESYGTFPRFVTKIVKPKSTTSGVTTGSMKVAEGRRRGEKHLNSPGRTTGYTDLTLIHHNVPRDAIPSRAWNPNLGPFNTAALDDYIAHVNSYTFANNPPGTVLFDGADIRAQRTPFGDRCFEVEMHFKIFPPGHNRVLMVVEKLGTDPPETPPRFGYYEISTDGNAYPEPAPDGVHIYNSADLRYLLRCAYY